jgi:hypothetical protein
MSGYRSQLDNAFGAVISAALATSVGNYVFVGVYEICEAQSRVDVCSTTTSLGRVAMEYTPYAIVAAIAAALVVVWAYTSTAMRPVMSVAAAIFLGTAMYMFSDPLPTWIDAISATCGAAAALTIVLLRSGRGGRLTTRWSGP